MSGVAGEPIVRPEHAARIRRSFPVVQINGWALLEHPSLAYDEVRLDPASRCALVGEIRHVAYLADMEAVKQAMRNDLARALAEFAAKVGVAYPLEDR